MKNLQITFVIYLLLINLYTFVVFGIDKRKAKKEKSRVSEKHLHISTLIGGTLGAWSGIYFFRHKNRKRSFLLKTTLITVLQILVIGGIIYYKWKK